MFLGYGKPLCFTSLRDRKLPTNKALKPGRQSPTTSSGHSSRRPHPGHTTKRVNIYIYGKGLERKGHAYQAVILGTESHMLSGGSPRTGSRQCCCGCSFGGAVCVYVCACVWNLAPWAGRCVAMPNSETGAAGRHVCAEVEGKVLWQQNIYLPY